MAVYGSAVATNTGYLAPPTPSDPAPTEVLSSNIDAATGELVCAPTLGLGSDTIRYPNPSECASTARMVLDHILATPDKGLELDVTNEPGAANDKWRIQYVEPVTDAGGAVLTPAAVIIKDSAVATHQISMSVETFTDWAVLGSPGSEGALQLLSL